MGWGAMSHAAADEKKPVRRAGRDDAAPRKQCKLHLQAIAQAAVEGHTDHARRLAEEGVQRFPDSVRMKDQLVSLLDHTGETDAALTIAEQAAHQALGPLREPGDAAGPEPALHVLDSKTRIFICGYFYSGSGAVLDYLLDYDGVEKWSPAGEMRLIKFPGGLWDVFKRSARQGLDHAALVDLYLHVRGAKHVADAPGIYTRWRKVNRHSRKLWKGGAASHYLAAAIETFLQLAAASKEKVLAQPELKEILTARVQALLDAAATDTQARYLLIDQAINAWRLCMAEIVPPSTFLVVHRDPRDQYVDAMEAWSQPGRKVPSASEFAVMYKKRRDQAAKDIDKMAARGHRILEISFEDFVTNFDQNRKRLHAFLGLGMNEPHQNHYSVQESRCNVGKYRAELSPQQAEEAETGNSRHLADLPSD
jgi:hypothetical protein